MASPPRPKVLVVDDSATVRDLLVRRLSRKGYDVLTACDGADGVRVAVEQLPDVVLMDLQMPNLDGWQAIRRLRDDDRTRVTPVIALTAHDGSRDRSTAFEAGCNDFDSKPISMPRLLLKIERQLGVTPSGD